MAGIPPHVSEARQKSIDFLNFFEKSYVPQQIFVSPELPEIQYGLLHVDQYPSPVNQSINGAFDSDNQTLLFSLVPKKALRNPGHIVTSLLVMVRVNFL